MAERDETAIPTAGRSRGPAIHSGGEQKIEAPLPPYKDLKGEEGDGSDFTSQGHEAPPRDISSAERGGVSDTDMAPSGPHGVGESSRAPGNEQMLGASDEEMRAERMDEGIDKRKPIDPNSPDVRVGDQGG